MTRRHLARSVALPVLLVATILLGACSSGSSSDGSSATSTGEQTDAKCPFTGTTGSSKGGSSSVATQLITGIVTSKQGCVDNIQMTIGAGIGQWKVAYAAGPVLDSKGTKVETNSEFNLVVTFVGGLWKGAGAVPTTVLPIQLVHVKTVNVVPGPDASLLIVFGLDAKRPYQASDSDKPAYVSLGIG